MCDERQCKRQPNNDYCHCEDHYMQMSNADCAPRSNTGCTPYQLEALENMCKMSCKENPLEYLIRAEANERAQATEADGKKKGAANAQTNAISEQKNNALYENLDIASASTTSASKKQTNQGKPNKKLRDFYTKELSQEIRTYLYNSPKAKAAGFSDLGCSVDPSLSEKEKQSRLDNAITVFKQWQEQNMMLEPDGKFGVSGMMILDPDNFEKYFKDKGYAQLNIDNVHKGERDKIYDGIKDHVGLSKFQQGVLAAITVEHTEKHLGDVTSDDGLAFGINHFTEKSKFEEYLQLFYSTKDLSTVSQVELQQFKNNDLKNFPEYDDLSKHLSLDRDDLWKEDNKYILHLQKEKKFDFVVNLLRSDIGRRLQIEHSKKTINSKIGDHKGKFTKSSKLTVGSAAICAAFGNSTNSGNLRKIQADQNTPLLDVHIQAGTHYITCKKNDEEGKNAAYIEHVTQKWTEAMIALHNNQKPSFTYESELAAVQKQFKNQKLSYHRYKRMLLVIKYFQDVWHEPYSEEMKGTTIASPSHSEDENVPAASPTSSEASSLEQAASQTTRTQSQPDQAAVAEAPVSSAHAVEENHEVVAAHALDSTHIKEEPKKGQPKIDGFVKYVKITSHKVLYKKGATPKKDKYIPLHTVVPLVRESGQESIVFANTTIQVTKNQYSDSDVKATNQVTIDKSHAQKASKVPLAVGTEITTTTDIQLRPTPSTKKKAQGKVSSGSILRILEVEETGEEYPWYKVNAKDKTGYVYGAYVVENKTVKYTDETRQIIINNANACLNQITRDLAKTNDQFKDFGRGTYDKNCANFVSYMLRSVGILSKNVGRCSVLRETLSSLGWGCMSVSDALESPETYPQAGDVWFDEGHTEIVTSTDPKHKHVNVIGSNNVGDVQVVGTARKKSGDIYSERYK